MIIKELTNEMIEECVNLYIDTFQREPWNDKFESGEPVLEYFNNFITMDSFVGYVAIVNETIVALSVGMKKPWIEGIEYYIDEFCVAYSFQGTGIGSSFLKEIEELIKKKGMVGMLLNTEENYPSYRFYEKNGFKRLDGLVVLGK